MSTVKVAPATLFDLAAYELEYRPSVDRQEKIQKAAQDERNDTAIPIDARLLQLRRARRWIDQLIDQLEGERREHHDG